MSQRVWEPWNLNRGVSEQGIPGFLTLSPHSECLGNLMNCNSKNDKSLEKGELSPTNSKRTKEGIGSQGSGGDLIKPVPGQH